MSKPKAPAPPDPYQTAAAQGAANKETALTEAALNRYNTFGPGGSVTWQQDSNDPTKWSQHSNMSPEQQGLYDSQTRLQQGAAGEAEKFFSSGQVPNLDLSGLGAMPSSDTATYQKVADALYGQAKSRLDPQFQQAESDQTAALAAQGITQGSKAYDREIANLGRTKNDAYNSAFNSSIQGADAALQNQFAREMSARGQRMGELTTGYNADMGSRQARMNEIMAILNPGAGMPQGSGQIAAQVGQTPLAESIYGSYQGQQNAYNQKLGTYNSMLGGLASLGGSAMMRYSDRRLKKNLKRIGTHPLGLSVFTFQYLWSDDTETGVMAQDVLKVKPEAVVVTSSGYYAVDYGML